MRKLKLIKISREDENTSPATTWSVPVVLGLLHISNRMNRERHGISGLNITWKCKKK